VFHSGFIGVSKWIQTRVKKVEYPFKAHQAAIETRPPGPGLFCCLPLSLTHLDVIHISPLICLLCKKNE